MTDDRQNLLDQIERDRDTLIDFLCRFIRAKSPNPPGDTREAAAHVTDFLDARGLPYGIIEAHPEMPDIVGAYDCGSSSEDTRCDWPPPLWTIGTTSIMPRGGGCDYTPMGGHDSVLIDL